MPGSLQSVRLQSLRWRLLRTVCLASLCGLALTATMSYWQAQHEAEELMDGHLAQSARLLLALVRDNEAHLGDLATRLATVRSNEENLYARRTSTSRRSNSRSAAATEPCCCAPNTRRRSISRLLPATRTSNTMASPGESSVSSLARVITGCRSASRSHCATGRHWRWRCNRSYRSR
ncbi:MAG: hypothetical protein AW12_00993 [Candidatus Accumulibacter sp. BA-94]|nr:MAG: hypothetical protein AW12_00993 [Candidatus Accumulibacter sp. BA-94]